MKAVIVEIRGERAAALLEDGRFISIPDNAYSVGQEITLVQRKTASKSRAASFRRRIAAIAASAVLVCVAGGGGLVYATPYGTVSMDVNPSIEYTINRFDRVLRVTGMNEDGQAVLDTMDKRQLLNRKIDQALSATVSQLEAEGYWKDEENVVVLSSETGSEEHSAALASSLEKQFSSETEVYSTVVTREEVASAHEKGMTAGRMRLIDEIGRRTPESFREADWADRPVKDLMDAFQQETDSGAGPSSAPGQGMQIAQQGENAAHNGKNARETDTPTDDRQEAKGENFPGQGNPDAADHSFSDLPRERSGEEGGFHGDEPVAENNRQAKEQSPLQPPAAFGPGK